MTEAQHILKDPEPTPFATWFVVQVRPNAQDIAARNLRRQGFEVFAPCEEAVRRVGARYVNRRTLLFPGYVFVRCAADGQNWRAINGTLGVSRLISFRLGPPAEVPDALIEGLRMRCDADGKFLSPDALHPGERVTIVGGPFSDFAATVEKIAPRDRIWILLDVLGVQTRVALDVRDLKRGG